MRTQAPLALGVVALASCLFAPTRPNDHDGDAGSGSGSGSGSGRDCLQAGDRAGPALAIDLGDAGDEIVVRGGVRATGQAVLWRFDPPVDNTRCPAQTVGIPDLPFHATSVDALGLVGASDGQAELLVLVSDDAHDAAVYDLVLGPSILSNGAVLAQAGAPRAVPTAGDDDDTPAFVELIPQFGAIWFGGGAAFASAPYTGALSGSAAQRAIVGSDDVWYAASPLVPAAQQAGLAGARDLDTIGSNAGTGGFRAVAPGPYGTCASAAAICPGRVAHRLRPRAGAGGTQPAIASLARTHHGSSGDIAYMEADASVITKSYPTTIATPGAPYRVVDFAIDTFGGDEDLDVATLWNGPPSAPLLQVYRGLTQGSDLSSSGVQSLDVPATRLLAVRRGTTHTLLLLADRPGAEDERCLLFEGITAEECGSASSFAP